MDITPHINLEVICNKIGHDWESYIVSTGTGSNDVEQAGYCLRCRLDTHGQYEEINDFVDLFIEP